jgi:peptide methionine sulfoxide reductase MsrA
MTNEQVTFGAGCFWGVEYVFRRVPGVVDTQVGYSGGKTANPTYPEVCSHTMHDPTQVDRQGPDVGDQYRSATFAHSPERQAAAEASRQRAQARFSRSIATEIRPLTVFYPAEGYHQAYYEKNGHTPYCHVVPTRVLEQLGLIPAAQR